MGALRELISAMLFDATVEEKARLARISYRIAVTIFIVWAVGVFRPFGLGGFARADDIEKRRNEAIAAAVEPLKMELTSINKVLTSQDVVLKQIRIDQLATKLRDLRNIQCSTTDHDALNRIATEINSTQIQYRELTGERYPFEACK